MHTVNVKTLKTFLHHVAYRRKKPVMIWGPPGVGKSQGVSQFNDTISGYFVDIRLGQYDSVDLRGIPVPEEERKSTTWYAPATLPFVGNDNFPDDVPITLFLDEINGASMSVSGTAYQLVQDGCVGEHVLKPNVIVIAAGNREGDRGVTNKQPLPLSNRFTHIEVTTDVEAWCEDFAIPNNLPAEGIAFLQFRKELITTFDPKLPHKAFATPRTWTTALEYFADDEMPEIIKQAAIAGSIGEGPAVEFWAFVETWSQMTPMSEIIKNPTTVKLPEGAAMKYAVTMAVSGTMAPDNITQLHMFLKRMSPEFTVLAWQLATRRDDDLTMCQEYLDFSKEYRAVFSS